jgi:hypothetical protein
MATEVEIRYRQGWRELTVVRGSGPVPPDRDEWNVAGIGPRPDGRRGRIWWAET